MQKNSITNKITPCCGLPFSVVYWWVSNLTLNSNADREFILSKISQNGTISIDGWKVLVNSGTLENDSPLMKSEFLAWFDCERQPSCEQLKLIIEGYKISNWDYFKNSIEELNEAWQELENKLKLKYNNDSDSEAIDIIQRIDQFTGENVNYRETTTWHDSSQMDDSKVDGIIYIKRSNKYYRIIPNGIMNIKILGAKGDGITDDSNVFQLAVNLFENLYIPKGVYKCNFALNRKINLVGDGSLYTRLTPFDETKAVITYKNSAPYWTYNTKFEKIGLWNLNTDGSSKKTGVGFTFGYTNLDSPLQGTEFYTNVVFENCYFFGFEKAVLTPSGNIGVDFVNCGAAANKYAFYFIDARHYGEIMHAGCKTYYGGEFSGNDILFYIANKTEGFGQIIVRNTIIEQNKIVCYCENTVDAYTPIIFDGCWDEANGSHQFPNQQLTIDKWTGNTRTTQVIDVSTFIFKGVGQYIMKNGRYCEFNIDEKVSVVVKDSSVEEDGGYGGAVSMTNGGIIEYINCYSASYFPKGAGMIVQNPIIKSKRTKTSFLTTPRFNKQSEIPNSVSKKFDVPFDLVGTFSVQGQAVNDGLIFSDSTKWTIPFTDNGQILILNLNANVKTNKYFLLTIDLKFSDLPSFWIGNDLGFVIAQMGKDTKRQLQNKWFTFAVIGYSTDDVNGINLWMNGKSSSVDLYANSFQCVNFDTIEALKGYLSSNTFAL